MDVAECDRAPPGFRFYPTEEELICFYLKNKLLDDGSRPQDQLDRVIPLLHIYDFSPWDLPKYAGELCQGDTEQWFFFTPRQDKEARGGKPNRLTCSGYWKATGSPGFVYSSLNNRVIGSKRTLVFYIGRAPTGTKTDWKMNEYRASAVELLGSGSQPNSAPSTSTTSGATLQFSEEVSLCRIYKTSKCLRSFDRRPSSAMTAEEGIVLIDQQTDGYGHGTNILGPPPATTFSSFAHQTQIYRSPILKVDGNMTSPNSSTADDSPSSGDRSCNANNDPADHTTNHLETYSPMWEWDWEPTNWLF